MSSCFKSKIKNLIAEHITDREHDKWVSLIGRYYRDVQQDPENTEIYLHKLLNNGVLDKRAVKTVADEKNPDIYFEYKYPGSEEDKKSEKNMSGKLKYFIKECLAEIEKYSKILSHRKF